MLRPQSGRSRERRMLSSLSPFYLVLDLNPWRVQPTFMVSLPISMNLLWELPRRYAQGFISMVILNFFTLAMKSNPHRSCVL